MLGKSAGSLEGAKKVINDRHLPHGGIEPHLRDQPPGEAQVGAAILEGLDALAPVGTGHGPEAGRRGGPRRRAAR